MARLAPAERARRMAERGEPVTRSRLAKVASIDPKEAGKVLATMVKQGILSREGTTRNSTYYPAQ